MACALRLYIPADVYTRTRDVRGRIVGTRNRTYAYMEAMQPHARAYTHIHMYITYRTYRTGLELFTEGDIHTNSHVRTQALVATHI